MLVRKFIFEIIARNGILRNESELCFVGNVLYNTIMVPNVIYYWKSEWNMFIERNRVKSNK